MLIITDKSNRSKYYYQINKPIEQCLDDLLKDDMIIRLLINYINNFGNDDLKSYYIEEKKISITKFQISLKQKIFHCRIIEELISFLDNNCEIMDFSKIKIIN